MKISSDVAHQYPKTIDVTEQESSQEFRIDADNAPVAQWLTRRGRQMFFKQTPLVRTDRASLRDLVFTRGWVGISTTPRQCARQTQVQHTANFFLLLLLRHLCCDAHRSR